MAGIIDKFKGLSKGARCFAAVDSDGRHIRVVYAERLGRAARVLRSSAVAIPPSVDAADPRQFGALLGQTLKGMGLRGVGLLMNVTRAESVLKPVTLPPGVGQNEVAGMVQFQVEKDLPFRPEEAVIDFTIESHYDSDSTALDGEASQGTNVLVGAVRLPVVDHYRLIAEAAGAKLLRLGLRPYANARCVNACKRSRFEDTVLLLNFGAEETEIDLLVGKSLMFSRSAAVKIPPSGASQRELDDSVSAVAIEVRRSVQSYLAVERAFKIDSIIVAGGTGVEAVAAEQLSAELKAPCELFDPAGVQGFAGETNPSAFISALGLAVGHSGCDRLPFDFLHPKRPVVPLNMVRTMSIAAAVVLLLACVVGGTVGTIQVGRRKAAVEDARRKVLAERENFKSLQHAEKQVKALQEWRGERRDWLSHWAQLSSLFPGAPDAYVSGLKTASDGSMSFQVKARDSKIITDLGVSLAEAGYKFQPGGLTTAPNPYGYPYNAEIRIFIDPDMAVDLSAAKPVSRPEDDDSIRQLAGAAAGKNTPPPPAPTPPAPTPPAPAPGQPDGRGKSYRRSSKRVLTPEITQKLQKEILDKYDRNRDGKLDRKEAYGAYQFIGKSKYARYFDENGDGELDRGEYGGVRGFLEKLN